MIMEKIFCYQTCKQRGLNHDDVIKWNYFPRYRVFVRGIHGSPVDSPHKGQWRGALVFSLICAWTNGWANNRYAGDLRRHRTRDDVTVLFCKWYLWISLCKLHPVMSIASLPDIKSMNMQSWWRHQMETFSALLAIWVGHSPVTG